MARVDVAMQASPEITWPEDLPRGEKKQSQGSEEFTHTGQETNSTPTSSEKPLHPGCLLPHLGRIAFPRSRAKGRATLNLCDLLVCMAGFG